MVAYTAIKWAKAKITQWEPEFDQNITLGLNLNLSASSTASTLVLDALNMDANINIEAETIAKGAKAATDWFSTLAATLVFVANQILKKDITAQTLTEGHPTRTDYERSLFTKLALAYMLNSVILPLLVGMATSISMSDHVHHQQNRRPTNLLLTRLRCLGAVRDAGLVRERRHRLPRDPAHHVPAAVRAAQGDPDRADRVPLHDGPLRQESAQAGGALDAAGNVPLLPLRGDHHVRLALRTPRAASNSGDRDY